MVFFTCNHCGESLKKPAVDKHYQWKSCKNAPPFLTCVDCLKDFRGDEYRAHTKCISEHEKYSAKGFVAKADKNKGAQKQEAWTEIIQGHLVQRKDLDSFTRQTLERIAQQTNVPRKKAKFLNFIKSCLHISPNCSEKIWSVVEDALAEFNKKAEAAKAEAAEQRKQADEERIAAKKAADEAKAAEAAANGEEPPAATKKEKKSKKAKKTEGEEEVTSTTAEETDAVATNGEANKKKKDKKRKAEVATTNGDAKKPKSEADDEDATTTTSTSFEWKKEITAVLTKKNGIKLDKLRKKVLKRLAEVTEVEETTPKDEKKFQKHLDKLGKFVSIENETVTLLVQ